MLELAFWVILIIVAIAADIVTSSFLLSFLAIGPLVACILSLLGIPFSIQAIVALVIGIISVSLGYPWAKKKFKANVKSIPLMEETYIGRIMTANEEIDQKASIKVDGIYWTVINKGQLIRKGEKFKIVSIEGTKLGIKKEK